MFFLLFCLMIEGSGFVFVSLTNGSGEDPGGKLYFPPPPSTLQILSAETQTTSYIGIDNVKVFQNAQPLHSSLPLSFSSSQDPDKYADPFPYHDQDVTFSKAEDIYDAIVTVRGGGDENSRKILKSPAKPSLEDLLLVKTSTIRIRIESGIQCGTHENWIKNQ